MPKYLNDRKTYRYALKMLGPRNHWPSISDHIYACLIEQFCDAADEAVAAEREQCAKLCSKVGNEALAKRIRGRRK